MTDKFKPGAHVTKCRRMKPLRGWVLSIEPDGSVKVEWEDGTVTTCQRRELETCR